MDFAKQIEYNRRLLVEDIFRRLEAALHPLVDAVNDFLAVLFSGRLPANWREQWHAFIAELEANGYRVSPTSVREYEDWIEAWARYCELLPVVETQAKPAPAPVERIAEPRRTPPKPVVTNRREEFFNQKLADAQGSLDEIKRLLDEFGGRLDAAKLDETVDADAEVERCEELTWRYNDSLISARSAWLRDDLSGEANGRLLQMLTPASFGLPLFTDEQQAQEAMRQERQISQRLGQRNVTMSRVVEGLEWTNAAITVAGVVAGGGVLVTAFKTGGKWAVVKALAVAAAAAAAEQGVEAGLRAAGASEETIRGARLAAAVIAFILLRRHNRAAAAESRVQKVVPEVPPRPDPVTNRGVWDLGPVVRGEIIHERLGQNVPRTFPVIDRFQDGVVTSIKSIDLQAPSYRKTDSILRTGKGFIDKVVEFNGGKRGNFQIEANAIKGRGLDIAVPPGATLQQQGALDVLRSYGYARGVTVQVIEVYR
jgi:hypothetical protein